MFFSRWRTGIEGVTAQQKIKVQLRGTQIILLGLGLGLFVSIYAWQRMWWVAIVLTGAIINTVIQYVSLLQQRMIFDNLEEQFSDPEEEDVPNPDIIDREGGENERSND